MNGHVAYADIPMSARAVLGELYARADVEIWWNEPNKLLVYYLPRGTHQPMTPRDYPEAAEDLANGLCDGVFF